MTRLGSPLGVGLAVLSVFVLFRLLLLWRFPPFYDEALYANWAVEGLTSPADRFVSLKIGVEPLFPWLGIVLLWLGAAPFTAVRLVSILSGLLTLVMCGLIGHELGGRRVGLAASALAAIVPFFVVHDVIGIYDPLATALVASALYLQMRLARSPGLAEGLLLGIVLGAGALTKRTTYPAFALIPAGLLVFDWSPRGRRRRLAAWIAYVAIALLVAYAVYSIMKLSAFWGDYVRFRAAHGGGAPESAHSIGDGLRSPLYWLDRNWAPYRSVLAGYVTLPIVVAAAIGTGVGLRRRQRLVGLLMLWYLVPFAMALLIADVQYPRYILVAVPPLLVLAAYGAVSVFERLRELDWRPPVRWAAVGAAAFVLVAPALVFDARVLAAPGTAHYPGIDDDQYVTSAAALAPYKKVVRDLRAVEGEEPLTVALGDFTSDYLPLELRNDPTTFVRVNDPDATCPALYAVESSIPLPPRPDGMAWHEVRAYPRPRGGSVTTLYEAAVAHAGRLATTPDELRKLVGGIDRDFDAFVADRPCLHAWLDAWYRVHPSA